MAAVWTDEAKLGHWLRIEVLACEAWAKLGLIPQEDLERIQQRAAFDVDRVLEIEKTTNHDVAAFVQVVSESVGEAGRWIHHGLTSSDLLDTTLALQLRAAADQILVRLERVLAIVKALSVKHRDTVTIGRTHGVHAEPTTFGQKLAVFLFQLDRDRTRLRRAREAISVGKVSGAVGTYSRVDPFVEEYVCAELGLAPAEAATQVVSRDRHAEFMAALALSAATLEAIALEIRHLARTEVREVEEPFGEGQKGSSAMPHKRNPVLCERICGLARLVRGNLVAGLENVALWHERDISHSSVERVILPDSTITVDYMLSLAEEVLGGLRVFPDRMRENLWSSGGVVFSQQVLLTLVEKGLTREVAYQAVQSAAAAAWDQGEDFRAALLANPDVAGTITADELDHLLAPERYLGNLEAVFARVEKLEVNQS
jgi:adenylosuccinate lyase